jgi:hypothetical protein
VSRGISSAAGFEVPAVTIYPAANTKDETMDLRIAKFVMLGGAVLFVLAVLVVFVL